jgi:RimJ/RimL family protein N-acetyltransferase
MSLNPILIDLPEQIETERLLLQMPKAGFGEKLHEAILDGYETAKAWLNWPDTLPTALKVEEDCRNHHAEFILRTFIRYIIIEKATSKIVGRCAFPSFQANWAIPQFGISYFIRKDSQSKGYATEAAHAMAVLAFQTLKARKVEIYVDAENLASCRVPEKLNFKHEYTQKGGWPKHNGELTELKTYAIFNVNDLYKANIKY